MNALAYASDVREVGQWRRVAREDQVGIDTWEHPSGWTYLALCGTRSCRRDVLDSVGVFLGQVPSKRIAQGCAHIREHCAEALERGQLAVGGHSLGGLVATGMAAEFHLPALVQNAPGYFTTSPDPDRCDRIIEVRTAGDVVSDWGSNCAGMITLRDDRVTHWNMGQISALHAVVRQNELLAQAGPLAQCSLAEARAQVTTSADTSLTGNTLRSLLVSWRRLREHLGAEKPASNTRVSGAKPAR